MVLFCSDAMNLGIPKLVLISLQSCGSEVRDRELRGRGLLGATCSFTRFWGLLVSIVLVVWFHLRLIRRALSTLAVYVDV